MWNRPCRNALLGQTGSHAEKKNACVAVQHSKRTRSSVCFQCSRGEETKKESTLYKTCLQMYLVIIDKKVSVSRKRNAQVIVGLKEVEADNRKKFLLIIENGSRNFRKFLKITCIIVSINNETNSLSYKFLCITFMVDFYYIYGGYYINGCYCIYG